MEDIPIEGLENFDFNFNWWLIAAGLIFGTIGWWIFKQGRKRAETNKVVTGLVLMLYPYFFSSALWTWVVGILLCGYSYYRWNG
jgi:ABC-type uncharacterized transport system permease subunit